MGPVHVIQTVMYLLFILTILYVCAQLVQKFYILDVISIFKLISQILVTFLKFSVLVFNCLVQNAVLYLSTICVINTGSFCIFCKCCIFVPAYSYCIFTILPTWQNSSFISPNFEQRARVLPVISPSFATQVGKLCMLPYISGTITSLFPHCIFYLLVLLILFKRPFGLQFYSITSTFHPRILVA